jgi:hypothetical protein
MAEAEADMEKARARRVADLKISITDARWSNTGLLGCLRLQADEENWKILYLNEGINFHHQTRQNQIYATVALEACSFCCYPSTRNDSILIHSYLIFLQSIA